MLRRAETEIAERLGIPSDYLSPIGMHLLLTIGILRFEWDVVELMFVYLSEIAVVAVLFAIVALFAAQPVEDHDADKWREDPSPEALELGLRPVARFLIIAVYVIVPTTVVVLTAAFVLPDIVSGPIVLLAYVLPIGAARVWLQGDAVETVLQHRD